MSGFITLPTFNDSFEVVGAGTFSSVDWPIGVQLVILFYFRFFICSPEPQAHHVSFYYTHGPASVGVRLSTISKSFSKTAWPNKAKFYVEPPWIGGTKG